MRGYRKMYSEEDMERMKRKHRSVLAQREKMGVRIRELEAQVSRAHDPGEILDECDELRARVAELEAERDRLMVETEQLEDKVTLYDNMAHREQARAEAAEAERDEANEMLVQVHGQLGVRGDENVLECAYRLNCEHAEAEARADRLAAKAKADSFLIDDLTASEAECARLLAAAESESAALCEELEQQNDHVRQLCDERAEVHRAREEDESEFNALRAVVEPAQDLLNWHDEELPKINGHLTTTQVRAGRSFEGEWKPCGDIVDRLRAALASPTGEADGETGGESSDKWYPPHVTLDGGDIGLEWARGERHLAIFIGPDGVDIFPSPEPEQAFGIEDLEKAIAWCLADPSTEGGDDG